MNTLGAATHYEVLGLNFDQVGPCGISHDEIKTAYRLALLANHPDKHQEYNLAQAMPARYSVDEVTKAYNTLIDPARRLQYNKRLQNELREKDNNARESQHIGVDAIDLDDLDYHSHRKEWYRGCRCGRSFRITEQQLERHCEDGEIDVECTGCSLLLRVTFFIAETA